MISTLMNLIRCRKKWRYGYIDNLTCNVSNTNEDLTIILSPSYYHIQVVSLNVQHEKEAIRYASSFFDTSDDLTQFGAYKLEDTKFLITAFDSKAVSIKLEEAGIDLAQVKRFVLAQEVFKPEIFPIALDDHRVLALDNGIVVELPSKYSTITPTINIEKSFQEILPCIKGYKADLYRDEAVSKKRVLYLFILVLIIFFNFLMRGIYYHKEEQKILDQQEKMKETENLPQTQIELDTMVRGWQNKENEQIKLRKILAAFSKLNLENNITAPLDASVSSGKDVILIPGSNPNEKNVLMLPNSSLNTGNVNGDYLVSLEYVNKMVNFKIAASSREKAERLQELAEKSLKTKTIRIKNNMIEGSIE